MLHQLVSLAGAALVLGAYALLQLRRLRAESTPYALMNFVGAALLAWVAVVDGRIGFIILEGAWALLSLLPLVRRPRAQP